MNTLKKQISEILIEYGMPTRQVAINKIVDVVLLEYIKIFGLLNNEKSNKSDVSQYVGELINNIKGKK